LLKTGFFVKEIYMWLEFKASSGAIQTTLSGSGSWLKLLLVAPVTGAYAVKHAHIWIAAEGITNFAF